MSFIFKKAPTELAQKEPKGTEMDEERPPRLEVSLKKQSQKGIWQTRYFVLYDDVIMYYNNAKREKLVGVIPCQNILYASLIEDCEKRLDILIKSGSDTYTFKMAADFQADARLWSEAIKELSRLAAVKPKYLETDRAGMKGKFWKFPDKILPLRAKFVVAQNTGVRIETLIDKHFELAERENVEWKEEDDEDSADDGTGEKSPVPDIAIATSPIPSVEPLEGLQKELEDDEKKRANAEAFSRLNLGGQSPPPSTEKPKTHTD